MLFTFIQSEELSRKVDKLTLNTAIILCIVNSSKAINIEIYEPFCLETLLLVKNILDENNVSWIVIPPTVHVLLAHSPQLIKDNDCKGLHIFTEQSLEASHKFLRQFRQNYAPKISHFANISDCLKRLWQKSDPILLLATERKNCTHCNENGHTICS